MNLVLIGPPGSGKGTQAQLLLKKFKLLYFSPGEVLRDLVKKGGRLALEIKKIMEEGKLLPDRLMFSVMNDYFENKDLSLGILFDGFPRNLAQAKLLEQWLATRGMKIDKVVFLFLKPQTAIKRLRARLECPKCGASFNSLTKPPKKDEICDFCQTKLSRREDDQLKTIAKRVSTFQKETLLVFGFYKKKGILEEVDGDRPVEVIFEDILGRLKR